jgi:hypothetical protein
VDFRRTLGEVRKKRMARKKDVGDAGRKMTKVEGKCIRHRQGLQYCAHVLFLPHYDRAYLISFSCSGTGVLAVNDRSTSDEMNGRCGERRERGRWRVGCQM